MGIPWSALYSTLLNTASSARMKRSFDDARRAEPALARFADDVAVLDHLHGREGDPDDKDDLLAALVRQARNDGAAQPAAMTLLWLALWPGLDAVHRRLWRRFATAPEDLSSEIADRFTVTVRDLDLVRVRRIAATLVMNVERDVRGRLHAQWSEARWCVDAPVMDGVGETVSDLPTSVFGVPSGGSCDAAVTFLHCALTKAVGSENADLVIAAVVVGERRRAIAERLGVTASTARKRLQRALQLLRHRFEKL